MVILIVVVIVVVVMVAVRCNSHNNIAVFTAVEIVIAAVVVGVTAV